MTRCVAELGRIHQQIIEVLPESGLRFVLDEAFDGPGQGGEGSQRELPAGDLHSTVRDWAMSNAFAPMYANTIADDALGAAVSQAECTVLSQADTTFRGTPDEFHIPTLTLLVS